MKSFQNSYGAAMVQTVADQSAAKKPKREEPAQSSKLDAQEAELRSDNKATQARTDSQLAGIASADPRPAAEAAAAAAHEKSQIEI